MIIDSNEYMTGIPLIDNQHKQYFELVNKLIDTHNKGDMDKATLNKYIKEVFSYAEEHFDAEEYLMRSIKYPLYEEHLAKHNEFRDKADEFLAGIEEEIDINDYVNNLCEWLVDWFKTQVLNDDVKLARLLNAINFTGSIN